MRVKMEGAVNVLLEAVSHGGATGLAVFASYAWYAERKENKAKDKAISDLTDKLLALASAQVESNITNHAAIVSLKESIVDWKQTIMLRGEK